MKTTFNQRKLIKKPWGYEVLLETNKDYTVKRLFLKKGRQCSYQYHREKKETIYNLKGKLLVILEKENIILVPGDTITINPNEKHRMKAVGQNSLYLECSTSELEDVVRLEDDFGR